MVTIFQKIKYCNVIHQIKATVTCMRVKNDGGGAYKGESCKDDWGKKAK